MITTADLKAHTKSDLAKMAKRLGIAGGSAMRKDDLVAAVVKASKAKASPRSKAAAKNGSSSKTATNGKAKRAPKAKVASSAKVKPTKKQPAKSAAAKKPAKKAATKKSVAKAPAARAKSPSSKAKAAPKTKVASKTKVAAKAGPATKTAATKKATPKKALPKKAVSKKRPPKPKAKPTNPRVLKRIKELQLQRDSNKDISFRPTLVRPPGASEPIWEKEPQSDRIALFVRDSYWLHASWDITRAAIERVRAAMAEQWHAAKPTVRLLRLDGSGSSGTSETVEVDIEIHGGLRDWYIPWSGEAATCRAMVGYLAPNGRFYAICESNAVKISAAGSPEAVDENWSDLGGQSERIFAMSGGYDKEMETRELKEVLQDRVHRDLGAPALAKLGAGSESPFHRKANFYFDMDIELVLFGATVPDGYLTLNGEPVELRDDGSFVMRLPFPDRRQVLPAVACSRDGSQQRTIVVAVERNTKVMEPLETEVDTGE